MKCVKNFSINKENILETVLLLFASLFVITVAMALITKNNSIGIAPDELGYWSLSAMVCGYDWSEVTSLSPFYGCGYGILLIPFMYFFSDNTVFMYHCALALNAVMLGVCVVIVNDIIKLLQKDMQVYMRILSAIFIVSYPANYIFAKSTFPETLLVLLVWIIFDLILRRQKDNRIIYDIALICLAVYAFVVHRRCLILMSGVFLYLIIISFQDNKENHKRNSILILGAVLLMVVASAGNSVYEGRLLVGASEEMLDRNNYGGILHSIKKILTKDGIVNFAYSIAGKIFYLGISTIMLVYVGIVQSINYCCHNHKDIKRILPQLFILYCLLGGIILTSITMNNDFSIRADYLFYGRYHEYLLGPVLVSALLTLLNGNISKIHFLYMIILQLILALLTYYIMPENASRQNLYLNASGLGIYYFWNEKWKYMIILAVHITVILALLLYFSAKNKYIFGFIITAYSLFFCFSSIYTIDSGWKSWKYKQFEDNNKLVSLINEISEDNDIFYINDNIEEEINSKLALFQFMIPDYKIKIINNWDNDILKETDLIITQNNSNYSVNVVDVWDLLMENDKFMLWINKERN